MIGIYIPVTGSQREANNGVPAKTKFWWGKKPPLHNQSPSLTREGDKGGRLLRKYKGGRLINI
jgi:hypothetical protein